MFIDQLEIEEILGEYYNFENFTAEQWKNADDEIFKTCQARGITTPDGSDEFYAICDGVIGRIYKS